MNEKMFEAKYEIVTRKELEGKIRENNLGVKYYAHIFKDVVKKSPNYLSNYQAKLLLTFSGITVYYDYDLYGLPDYVDELERMLNNIQHNDILLLDSLIMLGGNVNYVYYVELYTRLKDLDVSLYIVDYKKHKFIKIDIDSWLTILQLEGEKITSLQNVVGYFANVLTKYYHGVEVVKDIETMRSYDSVYY